MFPNKPSLSAVLVLLTVSTQIVGQTVPHTDICVGEDIVRKETGQLGYVGIVQSTVTSPPVPCRLRIETCASCFISLEPSGSDWHLGDTSEGLDSLAASSCKPGRRYLFAFDGYYNKETLKFYTNSGITGFSDIFNTTSRVLYVGYCGTPRNISLKYTIHLKSWDIHEWAGYSGTVHSPFFPASYVQNGEQFIYNFIGIDKNSSVYLVFDDWDIAPTSEVFFMESNLLRPVTASDNRPVVQATGEIMRVIFSTGSGITSTKGRKHLGFKFSYKFKKERYLPRTDCGGYIMDSKGGVLQFKERNFLSGTKFDCLWVVKKKPGYDYAYLKLLTFTGHFGSNIIIREGLTSNGKHMHTVTSNLTRYREFTSTEGFYVRLQGHFSSGDATEFAYSSYSQVCYNYDHYNCDNKRCISSTLKCDSVDHCGDNSDENKPDCSGGGYGSGHQSTSSYHMTISVIIPMVISVFLLIVLCVLFVLIRRCRQERLRELRAQNRHVPSVSGRVSRSRGRGRSREFHRPADYPPTYEEALVTGTPCPDDSYMGFWQSATGEIPKPPTYEEAITSSPQPLNISHDFSPSPSSSDSGPSNSYHGNRPVSSPDSSNSDMQTRPVNHNYSMSYSSESSVDVAPDDRRFQQRDITGARMGTGTDNVEPEVSRNSSSSINSESNDNVGHRKAQGHGKVHKGAKRELDFKQTKSTCDAVEAGPKPSGHKFGPSDTTVAMVDSNSTTPKAESNKRGAVMEGVNGPVPQERNNRKRLQNLMQRLQPNRPSETSAREKLERPAKVANENKDNRTNQFKEAHPRSTSASRSTDLLFDDKYFENKREMGHQNFGYRNSDNFENENLASRDLSQTNGAMAASMGDLSQQRDFGRPENSPGRKIARSLQHLPVSSESLSVPSLTGKQSSLPKQAGRSASVDNLDRSPRRRPFSQIHEDQRSRSVADSVSVDNLNRSPRRQPFTQRHEDHRSRSPAAREQVLSRDAYRGRRSSAEYLPSPVDDEQSGFIHVLGEKIDEDVYV